LRHHPFETSINPSALEILTQWALNLGNLQTALQHHPNKISIKIYGHFHLALLRELPYLLITFRGWASQILKIIVRMRNGASKKMLWSFFSFFFPFNYFFVYWRPFGI